MADSLDIFIIVLKVTLLLCFSFAALIGNVLLYVIIFLNRRLQTSSNMFLLCLALADILVAINMPLTAVSVIEGGWKYGETSCTVQGFFNILSFIVSVISLAAIGLNRYFYVVHWPIYPKFFKRTKTALLIALVWIFSAGLAVPPLFGWGKYGFLSGKSFCFVNWSTSESYMYFMIIICFTGPLGCMLFSYYHILCLKKAVAQRINPTSNNPAARLQRMRKEAEENKLTKTLLLVVGLFMLSWTPFVFAMFYNVYSPQPLPTGLDFVTLMLGYFNSMCNPIVYCWRTQTFRDGLKDILRKLGCVWRTRDCETAVTVSATISSITHVLPVAKETQIGRDMLQDIDEE